jgi:undecaprenyl-diphosphatase
VIWLKLIILGIVQGVTEFLPISSDGHLALARALLGLKDIGLAVDVLLHLGTLLALVVVYHRDLRRLLGALVRVLRRTSTPAERTEIASLVVGMIPVGLAGVLFKDRIEAMSSHPQLAAGFLFVTAAFLFASYRGRRAAGEVTPKRAFVVGLAQVLALLPGVSRSGTTISTAMLAGVAPARAASFSFLMAVPLLAAACLLEVPDLFHGSNPVPAGPLIAGVVTSFLSGYLAIRWLMRILARGTFFWFGAYCVALGSIALIVLR